MKLTAIAARHGLLTVAARGADRLSAGLERRFTANARPFMEMNCVSCHVKAMPKAQFNLSPYATRAAVVRDRAHWALVPEKLTAKEVPLEEAKRHPTSKQRDEVIA